MRPTRLALAAMGTLAACWLPWPRDRPMRLVLKARVEQLQAKLALVEAQQQTLDKHIRSLETRLGKKP